MTQEQARQEAERRVDEYFYAKGVVICFNEAIKLNLISINREIELYKTIQIDLSDTLGELEIKYTCHKLNDLNQIKDELLKM